MARIDEMATSLVPEINISNPVFLIISNGGNIFGTEFLHALDRKGIHPDADFINVKMYKDVDREEPEIMVNDYQRISVRGRNVILLDDVADSGQTLCFVRSYVEAWGAASVAAITLLERGNADGSFFCTGVAPEKQYKIKARTFNRPLFTTFEQGFLTGWGMDDKDGGRRNMRDIMIEVNE